MRICCDLCGGTLSMMAGGRRAVCQDCGIEYGIERLREILAAAREAVGQNTPAAPAAPDGTGERRDPPPDAREQDLLLALGLPDEPVPAPATPAPEEPAPVEPVPAAPASGAEEEVLDAIWTVMDLDTTFELLYSTSRPDEELDSFFFDVLRERFPDCSIERDVSAQQLEYSAPPKCHPINFLVWKDNSLILAVVLYYSSEHYYAISAVRDICQEKGIPYLQFIREYQNNREYILRRIERLLQPGQ